MPKATNLNVLRIIAAIGPVEAIHFGVFQSALEGLKAHRSSDGGLSFPELTGNRQRSQSVMPAPALFLSHKLPRNSVVRPASTAKAGAVAAATGLVRSNLFAGQPAAFFQAMVSLAQAADAAVRRV